MSRSSRKPHILITLGPTWEFIDPLRFITNRSTGSLGHLIAREGIRRGHRITCVSGPTELPRLSGARWIDVVSADQMYRAVSKIFPRADVLIMSAAVSDYRMKKVLHSKLKRERKKISLALVKNRDIVGNLAKKKGSKVLVGFSVETEALLKNALRKLKAKRLDLIVANVLSRSNNPFGDHRVNVSLLWRDGRRRDLKSVSKKKLAGILLDCVEKLRRTTLAT